MTAPRAKVHYAWVVLGAVVVIMLLASGLRAVFGVFIKPMEATFGWDRASLSGAAALSLLLLGAVGPIAGSLADRWGARRVFLVSCGVLGAGTLLSSQVLHLWQVYLTAGVLTAVGGWIFQATGSYSWAFISGALLAFVAAALSLAIKEHPAPRAPRPASISAPALERG